MVMRYGYGYGSYGAGHNVKIKTIWMVAEYRRRFSAENRCASCTVVGWFSIRTQWRWCYYVTWNPFSLHSKASSDFAQCCVNWPTHIFPFFLNFLFFALTTVLFSFRGFSSFVLCVAYVPSIHLSHGNMCECCECSVSCVTATSRN